ncbi:MAG: beta-propeller domain-containing protein [Clostridia bacterium]|nr:beta-propeller domain-containing protein [Clostridia bacterium]
MEIQNKLQQEERDQARRMRRLRWGAAAAAAVLVVGGVLGALLAGGRPAATDELRQSLQADSVRDYAEIYAMIEELGGAHRAYTSSNDATAAAAGDGAVPQAAPMPEESVVTEGAAVDMAAADAGAGAAAGGEYSETNVQVAGVDEADIVKTDGEYIYYLVNSTLYIARAAGEDTEILSSTPLGGDDDKLWQNAMEMYLLGDRLMILSQSWSVVWVERDGDGYESGRDSTQALIYDVSNRARPRQVAALGQSGNYVSSRMVGDYVYLVTSQWVYDAVEAQPATYVPAVSAGDGERLLSASDLLVYGTPSTSAYTVVGAVNLKTGTEHASAKAVFGSTGTVYCSGERLIVAESDYIQDTSDIAPDENGENVQITRSESVTKLILFSLDNGRIERLASGSVPGYLLNQFAMDEYEGVIRVVTTVNNWEERIYTDGVDRYEYEDENYNCLYTLDLELKQLGKLERLAEDEWVESVRFDGEIGYFVTFRQTDPLFAVDLSDPARPRVLSSLKIPGFSEYLHGYGTGLLLGLGYEADEETGIREGVKLTMFDVSNKANVKELHTARVDADYTVVGSNHKAILVSVEKNLIAFPADGAYYIYAYSREAGFTLLKKVGVDDDIYSGSLRGLFIGECFYVLSESGITIIDMAGWEKLASVRL